MEESQHHEFDNSKGTQYTQHQQQPSYWTSVATAGVIFGIVAFVLSIITSYATINTEPSGSYFSAVSLLGILVCLVPAFGGVLAAWHYAIEHNTFITLRRGALIC